jgi:hypothetical protein
MLDNSYETVCLPAEDVKLVRAIRGNGGIAIVSNSTGTVPVSVLRAFDVLREAGFYVVVLAPNGDELLSGS